MERHSAVIDTPAWYCFSIALRTKTVDFSARSEEEAALWVCGLRTLLEYKRGDSRGQEVGRFFWNRASMRTKRLADEAGMDHMKFISERAPDENVLFVGHENLCSKAVPILVRGLRECNLPTTLFERSTYLEVAGALPSGVVGDEEGLDLSRDDLYKALFRDSVPAGASRADVSNFVNLMIFAGSLEAMDGNTAAVVS